MEVQILEVITLREVLRLVLLSGCLTAASGLVFPNNSLSRRTFLSLFVVILLCMPWLAGGERWVWELGLENPPAWTLGNPVPQYLLLVWWITALLLIVGVLVHVRGVHRQIRELPIIDSAATVGLTNEISQRLGLARPVELRVGMPPCSTTLSRGGLSGEDVSLSHGGWKQLFHPRVATIILPAEFDTWSDDSLRAVLAHELVHVHRCDDRWMLLVRLVLLWYWWLPWLHLLYVRYVRAVEESCDDRASEFCRLGAGYLDGVVAAVRGHTRSVPYLPHLGDHPLVARVARFAGIREQELDTSGIYWVALGMLGAISLLASVKPVALPVPSPISDKELNVLAIPVAAVEESQKASYPVVQTYLRLPADANRLVLQRINKPAYEARAVYPGKALRDGVIGDVLVEYSISSDGAVSRASIISANPAGIFDAATLRAVLQTQYQPSYQFDEGQATRHSRHYGTDPPGNVLRVQKEYRFRVSTE